MIGNWSRNDLKSLLTAGAVLATAAVLSWVVKSSEARRSSAPEEEPKEEIIEEICEQELPPPEELEAQESPKPANFVSTARRERPIAALGARTGTGNVLSAWHSPSSPSFMASSGGVPGLPGSLPRRGQAAMSLNEKRDLDFMFRIQERQEGRSQGIIDFAKAKQARQRQKAKAAMTVSVQEEPTVDVSLEIEVADLESTPQKKVRKKPRKKQKASVQAAGLTSNSPVHKDPDPDFDEAEVTTAEDDEKIDEIEQDVSPNLPAELVCIPNPQASCNQSTTTTTSKNEADDEDEDEEELLSVGEDIPQHIEEAAKDLHSDHCLQEDQLQDAQPDPEPEKTEELETRPTKKTRRKVARKHEVCDASVQTVSLLRLAPLRHDRSNLQADVPTDKATSSTPRSQKGSYEVKATSSTPRKPFGVVSETAEDKATSSTPRIERPKLAVASISNSPKSIEDKATSSTPRSTTAIQASPKAAEDKATSSTPRSMPVIQASPKAVSTTACSAISSRGHEHPRAWADFSDTSEDERAEAISNLSSYWAPKVDSAKVEDARNEQSTDSPIPEWRRRPMVSGVHSRAADCRGSPR